MFMFSKKILVDTLKSKKFDAKIVKLKIWQLCEIKSMEILYLQVLKILQIVSANWVYYCVYYE